MSNAKVKAVAEVCANTNAAGLKPFLWITTEPEVDTIAAPTAGVVATDITMETLGAFLKWQISKVPSKNIWDSVQTGDADSGARLTTLTFFIPKITAVRTDAIFGGCSYIILCYDENGNIRIVGEKDKGATMTVQETINEGTSGYTIVVTWSSGYYPLFYTGDIPA